MPTKKKSEPNDRKNRPDKSRPEPPLMEGAPDDKNLEAQYGNKDES